MNHLEKQLLEMGGDIKLINSKVDSIKLDVEQRLTDSRTMTEIQYEHLDAIMEQHRQDNLRAHNDLMTHSKENSQALIKAFEDHSRNILEGIQFREEIQNQKIDKMQKDIEKHDERIGCLENKEANQALDTKQKIIEWIKNALVVAAIGGLVTIIMVLVRWDDFLAWLKAFK